MKKANEILNAVKSKPYFKSVHKYSCYNKLMLLLPPRFQKAIAFFYVRHNTLFGGLSHPGYKMELNYNKDLLKSLLKDIINFDNDCKSLFKDIDKVEFFVSKYHTPAPIILSDSIPRYKELSKGEFKLNIEDSEILDIFKKIREDIINNR